MRVRLSRNERETWGSEIGMGDTPPPPPPFPGGTPPPPPPPPAPVVGYGKRTEPQPGSVPRPAASMLHAGSRSPETPAPGALPQWLGSSGTATRIPNERTFGLTLAQLLVALQVILAVVGAITVIKDTIDVSGITGRLGLGTANSNIGDSLAVIGVAIIVLVASLLAGRHSRAALWFVVACELGAALFAVIVWASGLGILGFFFQHPNLFIILASLTGLGYVHPAISLVISLAVAVGLVSHSQAP